MTYLWRQVESQIAVTLRKRIFDEQRYLVAQAQLDGRSEARCFAEIDEVFQREGQGYGLGEVDLDIAVRLLDIGVRAQRDGAGANVAVAGEFDAFFGALDGDLGMLACEHACSCWVRKGGITHPIQTTRSNPYKSSETPHSAA